MTIWLDAQLPPALTAWIMATFEIECRAARDLGLRDATDATLFLAARDASAVVLTKDKDFVELVRRLGTPPQVLWLTCGNTSNAMLREILTKVLPAALRSLEQGETMLIVGDNPLS